MMTRRRVKGGKERSQKVRNVRVQDGSDGWRAAQESELMSGWAPEVMGEIGAREAGRISSFWGNRVGEMKALGKKLVRIMQSGLRGRRYSRPAEPGHLRKAIGDLAGLGPLQPGRERVRLGLEVGSRVFEDKVAPELDLLS